MTQTARNIPTARTAVPSSKPDISQTFCACLAHYHLLTSPCNTSRVLSKSFAVSKKKKENGKKSLAADMLVPGCFENPNARLAEKIQKLWRTIHLWFSIATDLLLQSFQRYEENRSINKAFFFSYIMYTHCTCRQRKKRHVCNALPKNGTAPQRHILRTASRWRRTREHSRAC